MASIAVVILACLACCAVLARYVFISGIRSEAIYCMRIANCIKPMGDVLVYYESFGTFWSMFFDFRKWSFNQFYPGIGK